MADEDYEFPNQVLRRRERLAAILLGYEHHPNPRDPDWLNVVQHDLRNPPNEVYPPDIVSIEAQKEARRTFIRRIVREREALNPARPPSAQPWTYMPDRLTIMISEQFPCHRVNFNEYDRLKVIYRIKEIATAVSTMLGFPIDLTSALQRSALAAFLKPIYDCFYSYLRGHTGLEFLFSANSGMLVYGLWFQLHTHLMQHGFSIEEVHNFIVIHETMNKHPYAEGSTQYSPYFDTHKDSLSPEDLRPEILQFSRNRAPPEQKIVDAMFKADQENSLALAMGLHPRLGMDARAFHSVFGLRELREKILSNPRMAEEQRELGYTGPTTSN